jgi:hypothetical protein
MTIHTHGIRHPSSFRGIPWSSSYRNPELRARSRARLYSSVEGHSLLKGDPRGEGDAHVEILGTLQLSGRLKFSS